MQWLMTLPICIDSYQNHFMHLMDLLNMFEEQEQEQEQKNNKKLIIIIRFLFKKTVF